MRYYFVTGLFTTLVDANKLPVAGLRELQSTCVMWYDGATLPTRADMENVLRRLSAESPDQPSPNDMRCIGLFATEITEDEYNEDGERRKHMKQVGELSYVLPLLSKHGMSN